MRKYQLYIGGEWVDSVNKEIIQSWDPATGEVLAEVPRGSKDDMDRAVQAARAAFESPEWADMLGSERGKILLRAADLIRNRSEELAKLESFDTGKPLRQAKADVEVAARYCEYYAGIADKVQGETIPVRPDILDYTLREPLGVSGQIVPWNYPIQIGVRGIAPALATGNTVVVKPAEDTPMTALELGPIFTEAGLPKGALNIVSGYGDAGAALAGHPDVNQITFTGSVPTGIAVMEAAAKNVVPVTLELGGKSPNIVFDDANLEEAADWVVKSITQNAGQTCSAGSRLLIEASVHDRFVGMIAARMEKLTLGRGINDPDVGPIISSRQLERIISYMEVAKQEGLHIAVGGEPAHIAGLEQGFFFKPTIITGVNRNHRLAQEEVFGPVLSVLTFNDIDDAIDIANSTPYGLVTGVWTENIHKAHYTAKKVRCGQVFINNYGAGGGVEMPFGGYRKSGFGREKGLETLKQYTQLKNIALKIDGRFQ